VGQRLSFGNIGKAERGRPESTTGPGKSGRPGWNGGLAETWVTVEIGTRRTIERVRVGNSPPNAACAALLSQVRGALGNRRSYRESNDLVHMAEFFLPAGGLSPRCSEAHSHQGDEATYVCEGDLCVFSPDSKEALEVRPQEVVFIPQGVKHQYINYSDQVVKAVKAVAPGL